MHGRQAALVVMLAGLWACGGEDAVTREGFGGEVVQALCARAERCGEYAHASACEQDMRGWGRDVFLGLGIRYDESQRSGQLRFDEGAARRCLDSIRGGSCDKPALSQDAWQFGVEYDAACPVLVAPESPTDCRSNVDCGGQGYCGHTSANGCEGVCEARASEGASATLPWHCAPGLVLQGSPARCERPLEEDAPCVAQQGGTTYSLPCAEGLWCDSNGYKTCKRVGTQGDICENQGYYPCGPSLVCTNNKCARYAKEGSACTAPVHDPSLGLLVNVCQRELYCEALPGEAGLCRQRRAENQECRLDTECSEGLRCKGARYEVGLWGVCTKATGAGEVCDHESLSCPMGYACAQTGSDNRCLPIVREGEVCGWQSGVCNASNACEDQRCVSFDATVCR